MPNTKAIDCPNCSQAQLTETTNHTLQCPNCGAEYAPPPPNVVDNIMERHQLQRIDRFTRRAVGMADLKASEAAASQQRMQKFWDEDRQRQNKLAAQLGERQRQERQLLTRIIIAAIVLVVIMVVILVVTAGH
jgi:DNA-directed RNA polymerase subunit M/transcription elongation factor TFIIS